MTPIVINVKLPADNNITYNNYFDYVYNPPTRNKIKTGNRSSLLDIKHANEIVPTIHADKDLQTSKDQDTVEHQQQTMYHQSTIQSKNSRSSLHQPSCQPTQFTNHMFCYIFSVDVPCCTTVLYMCSMPYFFLFSPLQIHLSVPLFGANRVLDDSDFTCEKIFDTRINEQSHSHTAQIRCTTTVTNFCFYFVSFAFRVCLRLLPFLCSVLSHSSDRTHRNCAKTKLWSTLIDFLSFLSSVSYYLEK